MKRQGRVWSLGAMAACTGVALLGLALSAARGTLGIPKADDWSYIAVAVAWARDEVLVLNGWVHMTFVSQGLMGTALAGFFPGSVVALQGFTFFVGVVGLVAIYWLARRLISPTLSVSVVVVTCLSPIWLFLSISFMTDIPAWALSLISIAFGIQAIRYDHPGLLLLGTGVALLGFGVREYAVVPFLALLLWVVWSRHPKPFRLWSLLLGVGIVTIGAAAYMWRQSLPGSVDNMAVTPIESLQLFASLLLTLGVLLVPYVALSAVLLWTNGRRSIEGGLRNCWIGASVGVAAVIGIAVTSSMQLVGNIVHPYGSSWTSVGDGVRSLPLWGFRAVTLMGILCLAVLLVVAGMLVQRQIVARSWRIFERPQASSGFVGLYVFISVAIMAVYFVAILVAGAPAFDRYLLLVVPLLGIVILWVATRSSNERLSQWQKSAVAGILAVTGAFGIVVTDGLNQVDGLRWQVASDLVKSGVPEHKIDGGDAWFRYHQKDAPDVARVGSLKNSIPGRTWWQTFFEGSTFCRMVAIESETDLQAMYGPALSIREERTLLGTPFRIMVFPGPDPC